jgi:hypothetical protein
VPDFHHDILLFGGCIEGSTCHNNISNLDELKPKITADISVIELQALSTDMLLCGWL